MFVFGPLWFVVVVMVIYYFVKIVKKARAPSLRVYRCTRCTAVIPFGSPYCSGCGVKIVEWRGASLPAIRPGAENPELKPPAPEKAAPRQEPVPALQNDTRMPEVQSPTPKQSFPKEQAPKAKHIMLSFGWGLSWS